VDVIRENLKLAQMRQKSYHGKGTAPRHYEVGDYVYLKVSLTKGVQRFGIKGKLAPCYIGPYEIIEVCGPVAYRIQLPDRFSAVHNVFHVTQLKKGVKVPKTEIIPEANAWIEPNFFSGRASVESARSKRKTNKETYSEDVQDTMESPY
jgi:Tfp pilus assembly protein PilZ